MSTYPSIALILISADPCPPLSLQPIIAPWAANGSLPPGATYGTPVSPSQSSHDPSSNYVGLANGPANALTGADPVGETETDATLVDVTDETWAVMLSHSLRNSHSLIDRRPVLGSGLLVKRGGPSRDDQPISMSVSIVHAAQYEDALLQEILGMYRGLGILARFMGVAAPARSVLPWHLAAAIKAQEGLSVLM